MTRNKFTAFLGAGAVSVMALTSGLAYAGDRHDDQAEVQMFLKAPQDITAAIKVAEASAGGNAIAAVYDEDNGAGYYEVDVVTAGKQTEVTIDATSGKVVGTKDDRSDGDTVDLTKLGGNLAQIVAMTETSTGGKVMSVDGEHERGHFSGLEIEVANADGTTQEYMLNASDGALTPITMDHDRDGDRDGHKRHDRKG